MLDLRMQGAPPGFAIHVGWQPGKGTAGAKEIRAQPAVQRNAAPMQSECQVLGTTPYCCGTDAALPSILRSHQLCQTPVMPQLSVSIPTKPPCSLSAGSPSAPAPPCPSWMRWPAATPRRPTPAPSATRVRGGDAVLQGTSATERSYGCSLVHF